MKSILNLPFQVLIIFIFVSFNEQTHTFPTTMAIASTILKHKILVVGSTGATGKHVVRMLLDQGDTQVVALTRSKDKLLNLLNIGDKTENLTVREDSIGNLSGEELKDLTKGCSAVVR